MSEHDLQNGVMKTEGSSFLIGYAGTGKTTALYKRLTHLLERGEPAYTILILVSDRRQRDGFVDVVQGMDQAYSDLNIVHYSALAKEMVTLFWPMVARSAGFDNAFTPPTFLSYDLAQLLMWDTVRGMLEGGAFADLHRRPQQIVSQVLDTLNRSAQNNMTIEEATERQKETWVGDADRLRHLDQAYEAARDFREMCLATNMLDISLIIHTFNEHVLKHPEFSRYFTERYRHLIADNIEEQTPAAQSFVAQLMDATDSATIAYDKGGGYRWFLAADPKNALQFQSKASKVFEFEEPMGSSPAVRQIATAVDRYVLPVNSTTDIDAETDIEKPAIIDAIRTRYRREMVTETAYKLMTMIDSGIPAHEIAVVVPYLDGALHHLLHESFAELRLPLNLVRRRAEPRDEPHVRAWLTWVALAHPSWGVVPTRYDVAEALRISIGKLDPVRAELLAKGVFHARQLYPADEIAEFTQERIGLEEIALYEKLRVWLAQNGNDAHRLDHFIYNLFTDLLTHPEFQSEPDVMAAGVCSWLVRTAGRLVETAPLLGLYDPAMVGQAFLNSINQGLITSEPPEVGVDPDPDGVFVSTIYGYLLSNKTVRVQVWMDASATGWWDFPRQPLSNAFVLSESWDGDEKWTMMDEMNVRQSLVTRFVHGLTSRCKDGVILATSDLDRRGQYQDGPLWRSLAWVIAEFEQARRVEVEVAAGEFSE